MQESYEKTIDFLFNQLPVFERVGESAYKPGLERVEKLSACFGNPHKKLKRVIHIAGTNGKGSTAHTLAAILQRAGYKTGLFTSPHLIDFRERIRIDGEMITKEGVIDFVERYKALNTDLQPSFFELTTILAFEWFASHDVDVAVIEVGLGGRLDSTNIVMPDLCVITNISLDHTSLLGNTLVAVAGEKAGIIKSGVPVVIGEASGDVRAVFQNVADEKRSRIVFAEECGYLGKYKKSNGLFEYHTSTDGVVIGELTGDYQPKNAMTILAAVNELRRIGYNIGSDALSAGFRRVVELTGLQGRWMKLSDSPLSYCDTGHNPGGWSCIAEQIANWQGPKHVVIGFVADKDVDAILRIIAERISGAKFYFTAPECPRRLDPVRLAELAGRHGLCGQIFPSVSEAYKKALADAGKSDMVFVGGSNYLISDLLTGLF